MIKKILTILVTVLVGLAVFIGIYKIGIYSADILLSNSIMKNQQEKQIDIDVRKRNDCIENGFDYEFVNEFWYIGVRCKKLEK